MPCIQSEIKGTHTLFPEIGVWFLLADNALCQRLGDIQEELTSEGSASASSKPRVIDTSGLGTIHLSFLSYGMGPPISLVASRRKD